MQTVPSTAKSAVAPDVLSQQTLEKTQNYYVTAFYVFFPLKDLEKQREMLRNMAEECSVIGLMILGEEGLNSTVCSHDQAGLNLFKQKLQEWMKSESLDLAKTPAGIVFKDSISDVKPFRRLSIKIRDEIVTLGNPELTPIGMKKNHHLSPAEWNNVLKNEKDFVLIDTRNWYETQIGTFKGSIIPDIDQFTEFPKYLEENSIDKEKKMLIFCTGGIRCEKGILELQEKGYNNVYQLDGGILNYMKEFPNDQFTGECFVFDHRVALDQNLKPTQQYGLCPHCGQPGSKKVECLRCDTPSYVCDECLAISTSKHTCSKNCANQYEMHPGKKGARQERTF